MQIESAYIGPMLSVHSAERPDDDGSMRRIARRVEYNLLRQMQDDEVAGVEQWARDHGFNLPAREDMREGR